MIVLRSLTPTDCYDYAFADHKQAKIAYFGGGRFTVLVNHREVHLRDTEAGDDEDDDAPNVYRVFETEGHAEKIGQAIIDTFEVLNFQTWDVLMRGLLGSWDE